MVLQDAHLGVYVVLHLEIVAVKVVGRDVEQDGDVGAEVVHIVQLETAEFYHVPLVRALSHLERKAMANVSRQADIVACLAEDVIDERGRGRLAVAARDADGARGSGEVAARKLDFDQDGCAFLAQGTDGWCCVGDTWTLDGLIGLEQALHRVSTFLVGNLVKVQLGLEFVLDGTIVGHENIVTLLLCQNSGTDTALGGT